MAVNVTHAFPVDESTHVGGPRRAMAQLARHLDFSEAAAGRAALVVSELATNLVKHARGGEMLLRALPATDGTGQQGLEVVAIDRGPGIRDVALSSRDGHSTAGTLGHGLGAVGRQADFFDVYTQPSGTLAVARIWDRQPPPASTGPRYLVGSVNVPKPGEDVCGDQWAWRLRDDRLAILLADGLGHGLLAHEAARAAVRVFEEAHEQSPGRVIDDIHAALRPTRGAAVAMLAVDTSRGTGSYCGLGNIASAILLASGARTSFVSQNGTAGHSTPRVQEFHYAVPSGSIIVMASDGLGTSWDLSAYPGLGARDPSLIAAALYRDFSRRRDDVTVVVARERQRAEHFFAHRL